MQLRQALIVQAPSLALLRAAADEIARLDARIAELTPRVARLEAMVAPDPAKQAAHRAKAMATHYAPRRKATFLQLMDDHDHPAVPFPSPFTGDHMNCLDSLVA